MNAMNVTNILDSGSGKAIVFSHGTCMDASMFEPQVKSLSDQYRVIAYNHRARTEAYNHSYDLDDLADDCVKLLDVLGIERCVLGGMSMGGYMALRFALRYQDRLDGLILIDTQAQGLSLEEQEQYGQEFRKLDIEGSMPRDFVDWLAPICFGQTTIDKNPDLVSYWADRWSTIPARSVYYEAFSWLGREDLSERVAEIKVPTLIIHGEEDAVIPLEHPTASLGVLPDARLSILPEAGHTSNLENPEAFNKTVRNFLNEIYRR